MTTEQRTTRSATGKRRPRWATGAGVVLLILAVLANMSGYVPTSLLVGFVGAIVLLVGLIVERRRP